MAKETQQIYRQRNKHQKGKEILGDLKNLAVTQTPVENN